MKRACILAVCAIWLGAAAPTLLDQVMAALAASRAREVGFRQEKHLRVLQTPLVSHGRLSFMPPDRIEQQTAMPRPERLTIAGGLATIQAADGTVRSLPLGRVPALAALAGAIRATLSGDAAALREEFAVEEQGSPATWRLLLTPRRPAVAAAIVRITLDGAGGTLRQIDVQDTDGNEQRITIGPAG